MEICGEHGSEIAYTGRDCPACEQIDEINSDHQHEIEALREDFEADIDSMQDKIDELESK